ncbi:MAG: hypothetical protein JWL85_288 [Candidatus Saccharibacteria bacterium]|nr:hypothetical protein [Candidatus Saccharibacteria bacterium]
MKYPERDLAELSERLFEFAVTNDGFVIEIEPAQEAFMQVTGFDPLVYVDYESGYRPKIIGRQVLVHCVYRQFQRDADPLLVGVVETKLHQYFGLLVPESVVPAAAYHVGYSRLSQG